MKAKATYPHITRWIFILVTLTLVIGFLYTIGVQQHWMFLGKRMGCEAVMYIGSTKQEIFPCRVIVEMNEEYQYDIKRLERIIEPIGGKLDATESASLPDSGLYTVIVSRGKESEAIDYLEKVPEIKGVTYVLKGSVD